MAPASSNSDASIEPQSLAEVEKLVKQLYQPGSPHEISKIQDALQKVQRSQEGWQLGDALLQSQDNNVRFFGALTFLIKINKDWDSLGDEDAVLLLNTLIRWLIRVVNNEETKLVIKKLCSALASYYLRSSGSWKMCIRHLILCMHEGEVVTSSLLDQCPSTSSILPTLSLNSMLAILWFSRNLAEEVKAPASGLQTQSYHEKISSNMEDAVIVLKHSTSMTTRPDSNLFEESISCFHDWIGYVHRAYIDKALELASLPLRQITPLAMIALYNGEMYGGAVELFTDTLTSFPAFLTAVDLMNLSMVLTNPKAQEIMSRMKEGDFDVEVMSFARLLLAYGDSCVQDLAQKVDDPRLNHVVQELLDLLTCNGYPGVEDEICSEALEFWTTFTEYVTDSLFTTGDKNLLWRDTARQRIERVIEACWVKIRIPPSMVAKTWDSDAKASFKSFRADVVDLLQSSYVLLGLELFEKLAHLALQSLDMGAWLPLEATLFCLNALADAVSEEGKSDEVLSNIFASSLFDKMTNMVESISPETRQSAVTMIARFNGFFEQHVEYLPAMLNFLFASLKVPSLAGVAARAISSTCSKCRKSLTSELGEFLQLYEVLLSWESVDAYVKERVIGAIAAIIQALPKEEAKFAPLSTLIEFVERDVVSSMKSFEASQSEEYQASAICALKCLASMATALRTPDNFPIELDTDTPPQSRFWAGDEGAALQAQVVNIIQKLYGQMSWNGDVIDASCQILRAGYTENTPGLFVFPNFVTVEFIRASTIDTARVILILNTAGSMLNRHSEESDLSMRYAASSFLTHALALMDSMEVSHAYDPEVAHGIIQLAEKMIPRYLHSMVRVQNIQKLFEFSLECLMAPDVMPKRAAAHFWAIFVQRYELSSEDCSSVEAAMSQYGPRLCEILAWNIGGEAARSELDIFAEPLRNLVFAQPQTKKWLMNAWYSDDFPSQKVGPDEKRVWLQKIMSLRGSGKTNQLVKDFWIACRGAEFAYTS